jgi:hypothetical protein
VGDIDSLVSDFSNIEMYQTVLGIDLFDCTMGFDAILYSPP